LSKEDKLNRDRYVKEFCIGYERYRLVIRDSGEVIFHLAVCATDSWGHEIPSTSLENSSHGKSVELFRTVTELLDEMVYTYRPAVLWIRIDFERRRSLYGKLVDAFLVKHPEYRSCDEQWIDHLYVVRALPTSL
jgi:hypothetical protein